MSSGESGRARPWLALSAAGLAWALSSAPDALQTSSALSHASIVEHELWRLWTGHFVHFGPAHLRGDALAFFVWAALLERESRGVLWAVLLVAAPLLSLTLLASYPGLAEYRGLSGLDCSLVGALIWLRGLAPGGWRALGWLCLVVFAAKCGYELLVGRAILAPELGTGVQLLPLSHVIGAAFGLLFGWLQASAPLTSAAWGARRRFGCTR